MTRYITAFVIAIFVSTHAFAHEMTPTYPELRPSYVDGLYSVNMKLFNRRDDVAFYEIGVYDSEWNAIPFASQKKLIRIDYLERKEFEIYIRGSDSDSVTYVCTSSKILKSDQGVATVMSRICSKIKRD